MADNPNAARAIKTNPTYSNVANVPGRAVLKSSNRAPVSSRQQKRQQAAKASQNGARAVPGGYRKTRKRSTRRH